MRRILDDLAFARSTAECSIGSTKPVDRLVESVDGDLIPSTWERMEGSVGLAMGNQHRYL